MDSRLLLLSQLLFVLFYGTSSQSYLNEARQRLNAFKKSYNNSQSDIIIFLDVSGSVSDYGFHTEKYFVSSLLNEFSVAFYSTRVAIITFGHRVRTNINFISLENKKTQDTTKCEFKKLFEYQVKHRKGRATYMGTALNQGHELLKEAERQGWKRKNVNTVIFMITDGRWNGGLDPVAKARELRNSNFHVDMYSIGVDRASHQQLKAIASAPDKVIYANSFTSFKQLAKYIRGDAHERVYYQVSKDKCATACHSQAKCTCGTVAGKYVCACIAGYSGNGINCTPCPLGSYKDYPSPEKCKACPDNSNTKSMGSRFIDDCQCKAGYEGNPIKKIECTPVKCPPIAAPHNGKMTGAKCNGIYRAKCFFECNTGYLRDGPPFRECLANKQWSGKLVSCDVLKCNDIPPFHHGSAVCSGTKYQDKCTFTCDRGYEIIGSSQKTCQANSQWTGTDVVRCEAKKCPVLPKLSFGSVEPVDCVTRSQHFGAGCIFQCSRGYAMQGNKNLRCKEDGTWTYSVPTCIDTEPPQIICPNKIETKTDAGKPDATIDFNLPEFGDNSQLFGSAEVKLQQSPEEIKSPYAFPVGTTRIHYTVTDKKGNINRCSFTVKVEDKDPPRTISCPKSKLVPVGVEQNQIAVSWAPVIFTDNCGSEKLTIHQTAKNNSMFGRGSHVIDYTAYDKAGNVAKCQFLIRVAAKPCKYYPPPINGGTTEKSDFGGELVIPACSKGFEFATQPAKFYQCFGNGDWIVWPFDKLMPWPDCTVLYNAQAVKGFEFQYFSGDCADPAVQLEAKKSFLTAFQEFLVQVYPGYCDVDKSCTVDNVHVQCGERKAIGKRRRRGTPKKTIFIDLDLKIENKKRTSPQSITRDLNNLASNVKTSSKLKKLTISNQILTYEGIEVNPVKITCQNGSVYGMNQDFSFACQSCPAGTHYNLGKKSCQDCAEDTYQEEYGRFHCNKCPIGTFTGGTKTKNSTECRAKCPGGEFSDNGLENCSPCPIGSYQHVVGSKRCNKCPGATTTTSEGAKSFSECAVVCAAGSFSETGVEQCELCPVGQYQTSSQNKKCTPCPVGETTQGKGATSSSECQVLDPCNLNPCNNGGACQSTKSIYKCVCKPGYQGRNCETEINECESNPCYEGASCLDKVNSYVCVCPPGQTGKHCDRKVGSFCSSNPCVNGACIEEPSDFICNCQAGYTGKFCESQINECASGPCENGGKCSDLHPGYDCQCNVGYTGVRCQIDQDGCASDPCLNEAKCLSLGKDFQCNCQAGYGGKRCEVDVNDCVSGPCKNNGKCIDKVNGYECECDRNFGGKNCEIEQPTDYDLHFKENVGVGSSVVNLKKDILAFTIAFWMKAADPENTDPGTPLSYAVEYGGKVYDNALVIHDYTGFDIFINNEKHVTEVDADDGKWHHIAVSWKSSTGKLVLYKDGSLVSQTIIQKNKVIPGGGVMILGQEQDIVGGNFTASEAFYGHISQVNMWNKVLSDADIHKLASYCAFQYNGNLVAWGDFLSGLEGGEKIQPSQACKENKCWSNWINRDNPQSGGGDSESSSGVCSNPTGYDCQTTLGYSVKNVDVNKAKCTAQGITCLNSEQDSNRQCPDFKVRFVCPCSSAINMCNSAPCKNGGVCINHMHGFQCKCKQGYTGYRCEKVLHCGDPRPFAYGKVFGTTFSPNGVVTFTCDSGFQLIGSSSLKCKEGQWQGQVPRCEDINECQQNKCQQQVCTNTLGGYSCSCRKGFRKANGGTCQDINECATSNGNCQGRCVNTAGSYRCLCGKGMQLTKDGLKCEDINECASNNARGPCDHFCENSFGGYRCKCRQGFTSSGNNCQATSCPRLSAPVSGNKIPNTDITTIDTVVTFSCHANYKLVGSRTRTCLVDGTWSGVQPICSQIRCHSTPVLLNGRRSSSSNHAGAKITYSCNNGYKLVGTSLLRCQDDYQWSDPAPRCIRTDCPEPSAPSNGKVFGSQSTIGSTIRYECSVGYTFVNNAINYAECSSNKQWSNPKPTCQLINCGDPGKVSNGQRSGSTFTYNSVVTYTCNKGYRITGSERRTCQDDGRWSGVQADCLANSCGDPGTPVNGEKSGLDYIYNKIVTFKCNAGYKMIGDASRTCQLNTRWSGLQPKCQLVHCGDPGIPSNGERTGSNMNAGSGLFYECKPGFKLVGAEKLLCQNNGLWSAAVPSCAVSSCGSELHGPSGSFKSPDYPNLYGNNRYCRWKIIVPVNKKVLIRFKSLDTENKKDWVTVSDPKTRTLITALTGINPNEMLFTSSSNEMEVKFTSNNERESIGFEATYEQVSCGGIITNLNSVIQSPGYPNNYPNSATCVWQVILPGQRISLAFDDFITEQSYDFVKVYNKVNQFNGDTLLARFSGFVAMQTLSSPTGYMHIIFSSNAMTNSKGFKAKIVKYQKTFGK